jgi:hypothetical protein
MTFYGVIAAILFLGACRQVIVAIEHADFDQLAMALTLMVFVFNDALFTSAHVERDDNAVKYQLPLKLIDLFNFLFLVAALVVVNPEDNMFLSGGKHLPAVCAEWQFWALLAVYWLMINVWTSLAGVYEAKRYPPWLRKLSILVIAALGLTGLFSATSLSWIHAARWVTLSYIFLYIALIRPLALRSSTTVPAPALP